VRWTRSAEAVAEIRENEAEAAAQEALLGKMEQAATIAKDFSGAAATGGLAP
jgi:hypothetical protein